MEEHELIGGNASGAVRVGNTVRKSWNTATPSLDVCAETLREFGVDAPKRLGRDEHGRSVQEFVEGTTAVDVGPWSAEERKRVGSIVRVIHDASAQFSPPANAVWDTAIPAPGSDLVCHNDLAPWNLIIGERWVFIDWDAMHGLLRASASARRAPWASMYVNGHGAHWAAVTHYVDAHQAVWAAAVSD